MTIVLPVLSQSEICVNTGIFNLIHPNPNPVAAAFEVLERADL